ncbi:hypothetical protein DOY81_014771, partial [Sarcophaga bullata]
MRRTTFRYTLAILSLLRQTGEEMNLIRCPKKMSLAYYYDLMSQPSRALYIILKMSGVQFEDCPIALRNG